MNKETINRMSACSRLCIYLNEHSEEDAVFRNLYNQSARNLSALGRELSEHIHKDEVPDDLDARLSECVIDIKTLVKAAVTDEGIKDNILSEIRYILHN